MVTVCDAAAREACPVWPGRPATAHWGLPDPAAVVGDVDTRRAAFARTAEALRMSIEALVRLRVEGLDPGELARHLRAVTPTEQR